MTRFAFAMFFYFACFVFLYAAFAGMPDAWEALNHGWPEGPREITCALLIVNAMAMKLVGHVCLLSLTHAR